MDSTRVTKNMNVSRAVNPNIAFWLERRAALQPQRESLVYWHDADTVERWTYHRLNQAAMRVAQWMKSKGVGAGDRVAFLDFNDARYVIVMFAVARIGAVFVPLNFRLSALEIVSTMNDCQASLMIYGDEFEAIAQAVGEQTTCQTFIRSSRDREDEFSAIADAQVSCATRLHTAQWDEAAWLLYTSGSTGQPKGVVLSHGNIFWNTINIILIQGGFATDKVLISAPLFHAAPVATFMDSFLRGAVIHLERSFDAGQLLKRISDEDVQVVAGVPAMYKLMAAHESFESTDLSRLRAVVVGGAPVPEELTRQYRNRGVAVIQRYGLTEAAPLVTALPTGAPADKQMTAGLPAMFGDLRLRGEDGLVDQPGQIGEIETIGPNIMQGYWMRDLETEEVLPEDGWLRTGDLGTIDSDGYLTVVGRKKDMIITGGENVYAAEVEARLVENPVILESAVFGIPDQKWGETVCAVISIKPGCVASEADVIDHLQGRLARYKQPRRIVFVDMLPKNGSGKIDKLRLKRQYTDLAVS